MDEDERVRAVRALNYEPVPDDREEALRAGGDLPENNSQSRLMLRAAKIQEEIQTAAPEQKRALYEQMDAISRELDG